MNLWSSAVPPRRCAPARAGQGVKLVFSPVSTSARSVLKRAGYSLSRTCALPGMALAWPGTILRAQRERVRKAEYYHYLGDGEET